MIKFLPMKFGYRVGVFIRRRHAAGTALQCEPQEKRAFSIQDFSWVIRAIEGPYLLYQTGENILI